MMIESSLITAVGSNFYDDAQSLEIKTSHGYLAASFGRGCPHPVAVCGEMSISCRNGHWYYSRPEQLSEHR
jgi:hypothetical protein